MNLKFLFQVLRKFLTVRFQMKAFAVSLKTVLGLVAITFYSAVYKDLDVPKAMATLSLMATVQFPFMLIPVTISSALEALLAVKRIQSYLNAPEIPDQKTKKNICQKVKQLGKPAVEVKEADLNWPNGTELLSGVDFSQPHGRYLTVILGQVGSGKSGLISALIGELKARDGHIRVNGTISYASQVPWIRHCSCRENIMFDQPWNPELYATVVHASPTWH